VKTTKLRIRGLTPIIMHNGQLADPLCEATQLLAKLSSKRKKTIDDHKELSKAEWYGSLYVDEDGHPCIPGEVLEAALCEGARKYKLGKVAKGGIIVPENAKLIYDGPKTADALWEHGGFLKRAGVRVQQARVIRSRPIFPEWSCAFAVQWDPSLVKDEDQIMEIAHAAGQSGVGDWRPKFGRFEVVEAGEKAKKKAA
jgi:hypothetical protein